MFISIQRTSDYLQLFPLHLLQFSYFPASKCNVLWWIICINQRCWGKCPSISDGQRGDHHWAPNPRLRRTCSLVDLLHKAMRTTWRTFSILWTDLRTYVYQSFKCFYYILNRGSTFQNFFQDTTQRVADHGLSASRMLKMEQSLGKYALDDSLDTYDDTGLYMKTPLESLYAELGLSKPEVRTSCASFPIFLWEDSTCCRTPSTASFPCTCRSNPASTSPSPMELNHERIATEFVPYPLKTSQKLGWPSIIVFCPQAPCYSSYREKDDDEYAKNNRKTLIDYKDFDRSLILLLFSFFKENLYTVCVRTMLVLCTFPLTDC